MARFFWFFLLLVHRNKFQANNTICLESVFYYNSTRFNYIYPRAGHEKRRRKARCQFSCCDE
jgi:hypothetical protein